VNQPLSRSSDRFAVEYPVIFAGAPFVGEGTVHNLSLTGCAVTSDRTVLRGSHIKLAVLLPGHAKALIVELGRVRWVKDQTFGVEFIRLPSGHANGWTGKCGDK
jgi:hypothetical protein